MPNRMRLAAGIMTLVFLPLAPVTLGSKSQAIQEQAERLFVTSISQLTSQKKLKTHKGREFTLLVGSEGSDRVTHRFLVQAGLHGNEVDTSKFVLWLAERYSKGESLLNRLPKTGVDFLPYANPDGAITGSRNNAVGVNLNRNFNILWGMTDENPGQAPFSEPEAKAIQALFKSRNYTSAVDVHGYINWIVGPSNLNALGKNINIDRKRQERFRKWSKILEEKTQDLASYKYKTAAELGDGGAFEDWAFWQENVLAYCLEMVADKSFFHPTAGFQKVPSLEGEKKFHRYEQFIFEMFSKATEIDSQTVSH